MRSVLSLIILLYGTIFPQQPIKFERYSIENGLSQSVVLDIVQDSKGFIWIATQDGLNRFDGYDFKIFKTIPGDSNSISENWINVLHLDKNENLWLGTEYGGLNQFNLSTGKIKIFLSDSSDTNSLSNNRIRDIKEDKNGNLWIGTWGGGICVYNPSENKFHSFKNNKNNKSSLSSNFVRSICITNNGTVWVGTADGLNKFDEKKKSFQRFYHEQNKNSLTENFIVSVYEDKSEKIWIGTRKGLNILNPKNNKILRLVNKANKQNSFPGNIILDIYEDRDSTFWIATYLKGIIKLKFSGTDTEKFNFQIFQNKKTDPQSISGNYVRKIFRDKTGIMWAGTWGAGLNKFNPRPPKFHQISFDKNSKVSLSYPFVRSFLVDKNLNIWVGTHGKGIDVFNKNFTRKENKNLLQIDLSGLSENTVFSMYQDKEENVWIATDDGLLKWNKKKNSISKIHFNKLYFSGINRKLRIKQILPFKNCLFLATSEGIAQYNPIKEEFIFLSEYWKEKIEIPDKTVNYMTFDFDKNLWVATALNGLYKLQFKRTSDEIIPTKVKLYKSGGNGKLDISDNKINHICIDHKKIIWIGTNYGLNRLDPSTDTIKLFLEKDGLPNNLIYGIIEDDFGNLWLSTNNGLSKSYIKNGKRKFRNYSVRDGLQSNEFNQAACYKAKDGTIFFGGINGFNFFKPSEVKDNPNLPNIEITKIKVLDEEINQKKLINNTLEVSYSENILSFTFAALEYTDPNRNNYKYYLEGFNKDWINSGTFRYATFTNLDPGEYKLKVKGSNNDAKWNNAAEILNIIVNPPFYLTWWFKFLAAFLIISLFIFIFNYRIRNLLAIERLRTKIASDLHDEVGSSLTKISMNAGILTHLKNVENVNYRLQNIEKTSREVTRTMSDVVWSIDSRNDTIADLTDRMRDFVNNILYDTEIDAKFKIKISNPTKKLKIDKRQNIYRIFKEAVNNAVKYSGSEIVLINITENKKEFLMEIKDYGNGISESSRKKGNGLRNMKMRAKDLKGKLEFINNNGFTVRLTIEKF